MMQRLFAGSSRAGQPMSDEQLRLTAPSAFATEAHAGRSERYTYIPTSDVIAGLRGAGFVPTFATQSRTRDEERQGHSKHLIRFRPTDVVPTVGGLCPELVLVNSHDGTSAYQLFAGLFRFICANGLMVGDTFEAVKVRHQGDVVGQVIDASFTVIQESRRAVEDAERMGHIMLTHHERQAFAESAHALRFHGQDLREVISPAEMLRTRRYDDSKPDLFTTLNVVQENALRGGLHGWRREDSGAARRVTTKPVKGIDQSTALNRALWTLADRMAQLKAH